MKVYLRFITIVLVILVFSTLSGALVYSQTCPLSLSVTYAPVEQLSISDVDFEHFESRILLFTLRINNDQITPVTVRLKIKMDIKLASGAVYNEALSFTSKQFSVSSGAMTITNLDFGRTGKIETDEFTLSDEAKTNVQDVALATGKFPAGRYSYFFSLIETGCAIDPFAPPAVLELANLTRVELRSPRFGETTNEFPLFEFFHEGSRVELLVTEKEPDQSLENAIAKEPPMIKVELVYKNSFFYSGGRPLEQGKMYAWRVISKTTGPGGVVNQIPSPVWEFTVGQTTQGAETSDDVILKILEELFGSRYQSIFEQIKQGGFSSTGIYILDGVKKTQAELLQTLSELKQNADDVELNFE